MLITSSEILNLNANQIEVTKLAQYITIICSGIIRKRRCVHEISIVSFFPCVQSLMPMTETSSVVVIKFILCCNHFKT